MKIYSKIPDIKCKEDCGKCCGFVPHFAEGTIFEPLSNEDYIIVEKEAIKEYLRENGLKYKKIKGIFEYCPYLTEDKKCEIYPVRPLICRIFGVMPEVKKMKCPVVEPERTISYAEYEKIVKQIESLRTLIQKKNHPLRILQPSQNPQSL